MATGTTSGAMSRRNWHKNQPVFLFSRVSHSTHSFPLRKQKKLPPHLSNLNSPHMEMVSLVTVRAAHHNALVKILSARRNTLPCGKQNRMQYKNLSTTSHQQRLPPYPTHMMQPNHQRSHTKPSTTYIPKASSSSTTAKNTQPQSTLGSLRKINYNVPSKSAQHNMT